MSSSQNERTVVEGGEGGGGGGGGEVLENKQGQTRGKGGQDLRILRERTF